MTKPTPRTKPIDLSKCKVGQRVKLRNGEVKTITGLDEATSTPFKWDSGPSSWRRDGKFYSHHGPSEYDIVEILDLPPAKRPAKRAKKPMVEVSQDNLRAAIKHAEATLKLLKGLLKP